MPLGSSPPLAPERPSMHCLVGVGSSTDHRLVDSSFPKQQIVAVETLNVYLYYLDLYKIQVACINGSTLLKSIED